MFASLQGRGARGRQGSAAGPRNRYAYPTDYGPRTTGGGPTMSERGQTRREWLTITAAPLLGHGLETMPQQAAAPADDKPAEREPFRYMLNTATIQGQKLSIVEEIEVASRAG